jgi:hypothetical protein
MWLKIHEEANSETVSVRAAVAGHKKADSGSFYWKFDLASHGVPHDVNHDMAEYTGSVKFDR